MIYLLYIALGYLLITSGILLLNRKDFTRLKERQPSRYQTDAPLVSVCIPARNEEDTIRSCVQSVINQDYPNLEIVVLDDRSDDRTPQLLSRLREQHPALLKVVPGAEKPDDWLGKPWACRQLSEQSRGDILIFIDADTRLHPDTVARVVRTMGRDVVEFLTLWPEQQLQTFWEKMLIPLVYYSLLSLLPARYIYRAPRWLPSPLKQKIAPLFAAACGQFMAFKRSAYEAIGGHESVKTEVVEDVALARRIKKKGFRMRMYHGGTAASCRMYGSHREIRQGFRKNFLAGFGYNIFLFTGAGLLHLLVYVFPFVLFTAGLILGFSNAYLYLSGVAVALVWMHRVILARWFRWSPWYGLLHPVAVLWYQWLGVTVLRDYLQDRTVTWKGRPVG